MNKISVLKLFWWLLLGVVVSGVGIFMVRTLGLTVLLGPSWVDPGSSLALGNGVTGMPGQVAFLVWLGVLLPVVIAYQFWLLRRRRQATSALGRERLHR